MFQPLSFIAIIVGELISATQSGLYSSGANNIAIILTHMLCFRTLNFGAIQILSFDTYTRAKLSVFCKRNSNLIKSIWMAAIFRVLELYPDGAATLIFDDSERVRSRLTKAISYVFLFLCKKTNGYRKGQNIVLLCIVTKFITLPIGFRFYSPDPKVTKYVKAKKKIKRCDKCPKTRARCETCKQKIKELGLKPVRSSEYKTKLELAVELLSEAASLLKRLEDKGKKYKINSICADAAYLSPQMVSDIKTILPKIPFLSEIRSNQSVAKGNKEFISVKSFFEKKKFVSKKIQIRGEEKSISYASSRLTVKSHGERMHIVAIKYEKQKEPRYISCTELTWIDTDVIQHYGLRWLIEVSIKEWKQYSGFGKGACLQGDDGARCVLHLSLLGSTLFLLHPRQLLLARKGQPLCTAASLSRIMIFDYFTQSFEDMLAQEDPKKALSQFQKSLEEALVLKPSKAHPAGRWYPELNPSIRLKLRYGFEQWLKDRS